VRFLRHLAAVVLVVGVVVAGGLAWNRFGAGSLVQPGPGLSLAPGQRALAKRLARDAPPGTSIVLRRGARPGQPGVIRIVKDGGMDLGLASMLDPVNLPVLRQTVIIEAGAAAGVVVLEIAYRRRRRARRRRRLTGATQTAAARPAAPAD
jgi:hypothetical protein